MKRMTAPKEELLDKYFIKSDIETKGRILDSPEDMAIAEQINKEMRKVVCDYNRRAAISWEMARHSILTR
ncbi:MAG: hypothetical protein IJV07_05780 [Alphaproteobacteria bacterium]|nr:hypothetical protein [Alphaproteobacteria bacterium]